MFLDSSIEISIQYKDKNEEKVELLTIPPRLIKGRKIINDISRYVEKLGSQVSLKIKLGSQVSLKIKLGSQVSLKIKGIYNSKGKQFNYIFDSGGKVKTQLFF